MGKGVSGVKVRGRAESEWIQVELDEVSLVKIVGFGKSGKGSFCYSLITSPFIERLDELT